MMTLRRALAALALAAVAAPAQAEVAAVTPAGFSIKGEAQSPLPPEALWRELVRPARWWNPAHTYTGKAANLTLDPRPGGCFCEVVPAGQGPSKARSAGGIEHMRVLYVEPGHVLRLSGGLGPLQGDALVGTLTVTLAQSDTGTRLSWDYAVGGYFRQPADKLAPLVDSVVGEQFIRLAALR